MLDEGSVTVRLPEAGWRDATGGDWGRREVWARCSVFTRRDAPLLVTECFAPTIARFDAPQRARAVPWRG